MHQQRLGTTAYGEVGHVKWPICTRLRRADETHHCITSQR